LNELSKNNLIISREIHEKRNGHRGIVLWFAGLSGSGKSTIANNVKKYIYHKMPQVVVLDGDEIRRGLNSDLYFSISDRSENIRRTAHIARILLDLGFVVLVSFISPYAKDRKIARSIIGIKDFHEVYIESTISVCESRDVKGLYKKARQGIIKDFTGVSSDFEIPESPEIIANTSIDTLEDIVDKLSLYIEKNTSLL